MVFEEDDEKRDLGIEVKVRKKRKMRERRKSERKKKGDLRCWDFFLPHSFGVGIGLLRLNMFLVRFCWCLWCCWFRVF